jgi:hypothetical protein
LFAKHVEEYDPIKRNTDLFFNRASNVQKAGEVLTAKYPRAYCLHGGEHVVALFFSDVAKIPSIKVRFYFVCHISLIQVSHCFYLLLDFNEKTCRLYNVMNSGASHGIYALFMHHSALANNGRKIGLLRGAGTRMASWFYAMVRALCLRQVLLATVHSVQFTNLSPKPP